VLPALFDAQGSAADAASPGAFRLAAHHRRNARTGDRSLRDAVARRPGSSNSAARPVACSMTMAELGQSRHQGLPNRAGRGRGGVQNSPIRPWKVTSKVTWMWRLVGLLPS
jgi:hypothetical protein